MRPATVLLADDHAIVTEGLRHVLEPDFEVVGAVANGRELVAAALRLKPDVIVADVSMPLLNGIEAARHIRKTDRRVKIVFLTMHPDLVYASEAFQAGASAARSASAGRRGSKHEGNRRDSQDLGEDRRIPSLPRDGIAWLAHHRRVGCIRDQAWPGLSLENPPHHDEHVVVPA